MNQNTNVNNFKIIDKKYQLKDKSLGSGSFGQIFLTENIFTHQMLACKMISKEKLVEKHSNYEEVNPRDFYKKYLINEVTIWSKLKHQNIVSLYEISQTKSNIYFFMELCNENSLFHYIKNSKDHSLKSQIQIFMQIVKGVKYMHQNSICHKDLKPENILLHDGKVKIADFSFAQHMTENIKKDDYIVGSAYYMSPQAYNGDPYSLKTDVWSLGVILYTLIYKQKLWKPTNQHNKIQWLSERQKKINFKEDQSIPKWLKQLIKKMLQLKQKDRLEIFEVYRVLQLSLELKQ